MSTSTHPDSSLPPAWRKALGWGVMALTAVLAVLSALHFVGVVAYLGPGGLQLPTGDTWLNYRESGAAWLALSAEQWGGMLGTWVAYGCLAVAVGWLGLARWGDGRSSRVPLLALVEAVATVLFALVAALAAGVSVVLSGGTMMALVEVPLSAVVVPALLGALAVGVAGVRLGWRVLRSVLREEPVQAGTAGRAGTARAASAGHTFASTSRAGTARAASTGRKPDTDSKRGAR